MSRQTYYTSEWENKNNYPKISLWISGKVGETTFCCRICHTNPLQLGNMGIKALRIHEKTFSHIKKVEANKSQSSLSKSFEVSTSNGALHKETFTIPSYQVKKAEILLAVHSILQKIMEKYVKLTKVLFPKSEIPEQLELGRAKLDYVLQFCLAPYYQEQLFSSLLPVTGFAPKFVSCFDEAFNYISKWKQVDVHVFTFIKGNNK